MNKTTHFKANAGLKDILGRGLIYDDNIAIIELVKNSQDADSAKVEIQFNNADTISDNSELIIRDIGNGMNLYDIENKWLNMAYSEKKGNTRNNNIAYAGNKGVGRFSCDRLGTQLVLYTKKVDSLPLKLSINWKDFENKNINDEVSSVPLLIEELSIEQFKNESGILNNSGTMLLIKHLRSEWNKRKYTSLTEELEKYSSNPNSNFQVYLNNKLVENKIFDKLSVKTTNIKSKISEDGLNLQTTLYYQGDVIYSYEAENPYKTLKNIEVEIHYLDTYSKSFFHKKTGYPTNDYGSIFLYHNGYRISPYGNPGNDWLGLDVRKSQGIKRYLSSREVIGKIVINNDIDTFAIITSREGLVHNNAFKDLVAYEKDDKTILKNGKSAYGYVINIFRQLETFVVEGVNWDGFYDKLNPESTNVIAEKNIKENPTRYAPRPLDSVQVEEAVNKVLNRPDYKIENLVINKSTIDNIKKISEDKYKEFTSKFIKSSGTKRVKDLNVYEKNNLQKIIEYEQQKTETAYKERDYAEEKWQEAEEDKRIAEEKVVKHEKTIEQINSENVFLRRTTNVDIETLLACFHSVLSESEAIINYVDDINDLKQSNLLNERNLIDLIMAVKEANQKIYIISKAATLKNYQDKTELINGDFTTFVKMYLKEISNYKSNQKIQIIDDLDDLILLKIEFIPINVIMMIDNIISNSKKANTTIFKVKNYIEGNEYVMLFENNGNNTTGNLKGDEIFEKGKSSTNGSGLGLFQAKTTVEAMKGKITSHRQKNGFSIEVRFNAN